MAISSWTSQGQPNACPTCGKAQRLEPCPYCLWWERTLEERLVILRESVPPTSPFLNDLWPDSLDVAELMIEYGDGLEFTIPEEAYRTMRSVEDAVEYIDAHLRQLKQS